MRHIFETGFLSDAKLIVGRQKKEVKVHRLVLEMASPVFHKLFKAKGVTKNELVIEDVDPNVFIIFLRYLYLEEFGVAADKDIICVPLLKIAIKFQVQNLLGFCADKVVGEMTEKNVTTLFMELGLLKNEELTEAILAYFCRNAYKIVDTDEFLQLNEECLNKILKRDDLRVNSELHIFNAVLRWGEAECRRQNLDPGVPENLGKVLKKALGYIRFPNMKPKEFSLHVAKKNVLEDKEVISLFMFFNESMGKRKVGRFNTRPRKYLKTGYKRPYTVSRGAEVGNWERYFVNPSESLQLEVNKQICLVGLKLFMNPEFEEDGRNDFSKSRCTISIQSLPSGKRLYDKEVKAFNVFKTIDLELVELKANARYQINLCLMGSSKISKKGHLVNYEYFDYWMEATGLQSECHVECEAEKGTEKIHFRFSRGDSKELAIDEGIIKEIVFKIQD